jgi:hypothetical protein
VPRLNDGGRSKDGNADCFGTNFLGEIDQLVDRGRGGGVFRFEPLLAQQLRKHRPDNLIAQGARRQSEHAADRGNWLSGYFRRDGFVGFYVGLWHRLSSQVLHHFLHILEKSRALLYWQNTAFRVYLGAVNTGMSIESLSLVNEFSFK